MNKNYTTFIDENGVRVSTKNFVTSSFSFTVPTGAKYMFFRIGAQDSVAGDVYQFTVSVTKFPMLTYEPYHEPITANIYLSEPLRKIGNELEYIDFREQKQYFADGTSADVALPAFPTIEGTNIITVDTETQPSKVYLQGNITVVAAPTQSLQASPQTIDLQPLSLDVVEKPDLQLEESEQEENIIETTGGVENAE